MLRWPFAKMAENHHFERKAPQRWQFAFWFLLVGALTVAFFWKLVLTDQYVWFDHPDMAYLEIPRLQFEAREIHKGRAPMWDPHIWMGQPLIGQTQPGPVYPLNILLAMTPLRDGYLRFGFLNAYWVLIHFLAAWFSFLLARDLGLSAQAGLAAACLFGFGGFIGSVAWLDVLNGAIWAPPVFLFVLRAERGGATLRDAGLGGLSLGLAWLSGHHEMPILISAAAGVTWLWLARRDRRLLLHAALFFAVAILISGAQMAPTVEFGRLSRRWIGLENNLGWTDKVPYLSHTIYSLTPRALLGTVIPKMGQFADTSPYIGWIGSALAFAGIAMCWRQRVVRWAAVLLTVSIVYSLGAAAPLNGLLYAVFPLMDKARIPARGIILIHLALTVLAAYGMEALLRDPANVWTRRLRNVLLWAGVVVINGALMTEALQDDKHALGGMAALAGAAVLTGWRRGALTKQVTVAGLMTLIIVELSGGATSAYPNRYAKDANKFVSVMTGNQDIALKLAAETEPARVSVEEDSVGANFGDWHGVDMYQGYVAGASENLLRHEMHLPRTQDLFGVTHWMAKAANRPDQQYVFTGASGLKLFRNPNALPRVRVVHQTRQVASDVHLRLAMQDPGVDLARTALFLGPAPALESCDGEDKVKIAGRSTDRWVLDVDVPCRGLLVVSNTFYPGWAARVDGAPTRVMEAYGALQSVVVERGRHRVELLFRPKIVLWGLAMTIAGLALAAVVALRHRSVTFAARK